MGEMADSDVGGTGYKSFPVKVVAFRIGWIIRTEDGKNFLNEILSSENLEYYNL